ncbi:MAG: exonuclease domain-containing protein [Lachnospiraceae bacterium]|jgi:inhibitor of KinA sporulation pathway (predicted exonuclease)|nr:exonuclease domain-containing protein [Lachnospiraceae bacterium]
MRVIVFDLEWNQGTFTNGHKRIEGFTAEIIEIGAVRLDDSMKPVDSFHAYVKPQIFLTIHQVTDKLLHIDTKELNEAEPFVQVFQRFLAWCGTEDYRFGTWGIMDLSILQKNIAYYQMESLSDGPIPFLDVQKLFGYSQNTPKLRSTLEYAVDTLALAKEIPFHRALDDATYTAKVLQQIATPQLMQYISYNVFHPPIDRSREIRIAFDTYTKYISRPFPDKPTALSDKEVASSRCPLCHRNLRKKVKWFTVNGFFYNCLAYCEIHGYLKGKVRMYKWNGPGIYVVKTTRFVTQEEADAMFLRKQLAAEHRSRRNARKRLRDSLKKSEPPQNGGEDPVETAQTTLSNDS